MYRGRQVRSQACDDSADELVVKVLTATVFWKESQIVSHSDGTRKSCRECNLDACGPKRDTSPSKIPTGRDPSPEAAAMNGIANKTQEKISIRTRMANRKTRRCS